jgi:hypothetical protein
VISHLDSKFFTIIFVEVDNRNIVGVLPDLGDLIPEIKIGELSDITSFVVIHWLSY